MIHVLFNTQECLMQTTYEQGEKYSKGSRVLHWLIALIVISLLIMGFFLGDLPKSVKPIAYMMHKSFGISIIFLMILRFIWLVKTGKPRLPASVPVWQRIAARSVQHTFYLLLLIMPFAGWIMSMASDKVPLYFGLFPFSLPGISPNKELAKTMFQIHSTVAWILIAFIILHVAGAIKHHFIDKDDVLKKML